jgi:hypothetical protein
MTIMRYSILIFLIAGAIMPATAGDFQPFEIGSPNASEQVLVIMEKTEFKLGVLQGIADAFEGEDIRFHVEPYQVYGDVDESDWNAILIMAPVYSDNVSEPTRVFINSLNNKRKVYVLATSGDSEFRMEMDSVDTVSSVSLKSGQAGALINRVAAALKERLSY